jgi:hypothetical protein
VVGLDDLIGEIGETVRQVLPDPAARREFDLKLAEIADRHAERINQQVLAQIEVNKVEAGHSNIFVAGWRPFIGWTCGAGVAWNFVVSPFLVGVGLTEAGTLNLEYLITLVLTMLGASGLRTFEKTRGIADERLRKAPTAEQAELLLTDEVPIEEEIAPWNRK